MRVFGFGRNGGGAALGLTSPLEQLNRRSDLFLDIVGHGAGAADEIFIIFA
jgi:hypothetical protein